MGLTLRFGSAHAFVLETTMPKIKLHKLAAVAVLVATAAWVATGEFSSVGSAADEAPPPPAETAAAGPAVHTVSVINPPEVEHARAIRVPGRTAADQRSVLAARTTGIIEELPVEKGQEVRKGDLIMRLEAEGKEAAVESARQTLEQRRAELEAAQRLAKGGNLAKLQLDQARTALAQAQSQLEAAEAELDRTIVRAPFNGVVDSVAVEVGSSVMQGEEIATVLNLKPILAVGQVSEHDLSHVSKGNAAEVHLVDGRVVEGKVRYVSRDAAEGTRTFRFEVAVPNPDAKIPAGMTAEITIRADPVQSVLVPRSVITLGENGELGVNAVDASEKVVFYPIDLVDDTPDGLYLAGIPADARIIVAGQDLVKAGDVVNPVPADASLVGKLASDEARPAQ
jgi:multidrug efflux system membrane fusion protein